MRFSPPRSRMAQGLVLAAALMVSGFPSRAGARVDKDDDERARNNRDFRFDFGLFTGFHWFAKDHGLGRNQGDPEGMSPGNGASLGGRLGLNFNRWVTIEVEGAATPTQLANKAADIWIFEYRASLIVHLAQPYVFRPFLNVGYGGLTSVINADFAGNRIPEADVDGFLHAGLGFKIGFGDRAGLRLEGRILAPGAILGDVLPIGDEVGFGGPDFAVLGGFYLHFGEVERTKLVIKKEITVMAPPPPPPPVPTPKDPDGDGLIGDADKCPEVAEDRDGFEDRDGCPDPDNDQDGIPDDRDKCPGDAEDKDGFQDEDGCPDLDNDSDGIPDARDKCPDEAEDKDGFQDEDGCPELDNDSDGILDARDKCPNEAETKNKFEDDDGCPDEIPVEVKKFMGVIEGINFKTGSAEILPGSYALLDRAVKVLQEYKDVMLEISGHTDSRGKANYNRDLSQRRADAVKQYFLARGIDPTRLQTIGYGMDRPLADNATEAGRAQNRRIEFRLITAGEK